jgi:ribosomal-protein-alanine N-acetyltransferase
MSISIPTLLTNNLTLRPIHPTDAASLYRIYNTDGVLQYFPNTTPPPLEKVDRFVARQLAHWEEYGYGNWAVTTHDSSEIIGWAGLQFLPETSETEVGYLLDKAHWGKGYATEAARASLEFGFKNFNFLEIIALVEPDNIASLKVAAKCGLVAVERKVYWGVEMVRHVLKRHPAT